MYMPGMVSVGHVRHRYTRPDDSFDREVVGARPQGEKPLRTVNNGFYAQKEPHHRAIP